MIAITAFCAGLYIGIKYRDRIVEPFEFPMMGYRDPTKLFRKEYWQ